MLRWGHSSACLALSPANWRLWYQITIKADQALKNSLSPPFLPANCWHRFHSPAQQETFQFSPRSAFSEDSLTVAAATLHATVCTNTVCTLSSKHWHTYHCLDARKHSTPRWRQPLETECGCLSGRGINVVKHSVHLPENRCATSMKYKHRRKRLTVTSSFLFTPCGF